MLPRRGAVVASSSSSRLCDRPVLTKPYTLAMMMQAYGQAMSRFAGAGAMRNAARS